MTQSNSPGFTPRHWIAMTAVIAGLVAVYLHLWKLGYMGPLVCNAKHSCEFVMTSQWGRFAGVDVALINRAEPQPEISRLADVRHHLGRSDQGFRGNTVGENGGAAKPIAVDQCGLAAQPSGDQRCLVTTRTSTDNHYPGHLRILPSP